MNLFLQFGYGMMEHCRELVPSMPGTTVILSPRDLNENQIESSHPDASNCGHYHRCCLANTNVYFHRLR